MTLKRSLMRSSGPEILEMKCNIRRDLECIPEPGPPLSHAAAAEVLLVGQLHLQLLGGDIPVLLTLTDVNLRVVLEGTAGLHGELVDAPVLEVLLKDESTTPSQGQYSSVIYSAISYDMKKSYK